MLVTSSVVKGMGVVRDMCAAVLTHGLIWQYATAPHWGLHHGRPRCSQLGPNIVKEDKLSDLRQV